MSDTLKDLLKKMLTVNPTYRISWDDYFKHQFFNVVSDSDPELEKYEKKYGSTRKLSEETQGMYYISKAINRQTNSFVYIKEIDRNFIDSSKENTRIFKNEIDILRKIKELKDNNCFLNLIDLYVTKK